MSLCLPGMGNFLFGTPHFIRKTSGLPNISTCEFVNLEDKEEVKPGVVRIK